MPTLICQLTSFPPPVTLIFPTKTTEWDEKALFLVVCTATDGQAKAKNGKEFERKGSRKSPKAKKLLSLHHRRLY